MIKVENVHKSFGSNHILKGVGLEVDQGDVIVILGPSGGGKTTFLRCINFLERADEGTLTISGKTYDLKSATQKQVLAARRNIGFVFQNHNLFLNKTALENVTLGLTVGRGMPKKEAQEIGRKALDDVGLSDKYDEYPSALSGGQQQRVGIARAVALNPELILFDEPTSALDPELVGETLRIIRRVAQKGISMIIVTHEMSFANDVARKVVFMDGGVIIEEGKPEQIFSNPQHERTRQFLRRILPENDYQI